MTFGPGILTWILKTWSSHSIKHLPKNNSYKFQTINPLCIGSPLLLVIVVTWLGETLKNYCELYIKSCTSSCGWGTCPKQSLSILEFLVTHGREGQRNWIVTLPSEQMAALDKGWDSGRGGFESWLQNSSSTRHWTNCTASCHLAYRWGAQCPTHRFCRGPEWYIMQTVTLEINRGYPCHILDSLGI